MASNEIIEAIQNLKEILYVLKIAHNYGREDIIDSLSYHTLDCENEYEIMMDAIQLVSDIHSYDYSDETEICSMFFSDANMHEYYTLCRQYSKLFNVSLSENPYMIKAKQEVHSNMFENGCYYCDYHLHTKVNHKGACGIVFRFDLSYFYEYPALFSRLVVAFAFYRDELPTLKNEIWKKLLTLQTNVLYLPEKVERSAA